MSRYKKIVAKCHVFRYTLTELENYIRANGINNLLSQDNT